MGHWGTAISSNDTYADIYSAFFDSYNNGDNVTEISKKLIQENQDLINDKLDSNNFWFALAKAQWDCKELDSEVLKRIEKIIISNSDIKLWEELSANKSELKKRKINLENFLNKLKSDKPKARKRKKKIIRQPVFQKGDCITFKLNNGNFGGVIALEAIFDTEFGYNLLAITRINKKNKPSLSDFKKAELLVINYGNHSYNKECVYWYYPIRHKEYSHLINIVGNLDVFKTYTFNFNNYGFVADFDLWFMEPINKQIESEKEKTKPSKTIKISNLINPPKVIIKRSKWSFILNYFKN